MLIAFQPLSNLKQEARFNLPFDELSREQMEYLTEQMRQHGQLTRLGDCEVAFSTEDRTRKPDVTVQYR